MKELKVKNVVCRLCMDLSTEYTNIFVKNKEYGYAAATVIKDLLQLEASETDSYPNAVCNICLKQLKEFRDFKHKCLITKAVFDQQNSTGRYLRFPLRKVDLLVDPPDIDKIVGKQPCYFVPFTTPAAVVLSVGNNQQNLPLDTQAIQKKLASILPCVNVATKTTTSQEEQPTSSTVAANSVESQPQDQVKETAQIQKRLVSILPRVKVATKTTTSLEEEPTSSTVATNSVESQPQDQAKEIAHFRKRMVSILPRVKVATKTTTSQEEQPILSTVAANSVESQPQDQVKETAQIQKRAGPRILRPAFQKVKLGGSSSSEDQSTAGSSPLRLMSYSDAEASTSVTKKGNDVRKCCFMMCYYIVSIANQKKLRKDFDNLEKKQAQDLYLMKCMNKNIQMQEEPPIHNRECTWYYTVTVRGKTYRVCQSFLQNVLQVTEKRLRIIQEKMKKPRVKFVGPAYKKVTVRGKTFYEKIPTRSREDECKIYGNMVEGSAGNEDMNTDFSEFSSGSVIQDYDGWVDMRQDKNVDDYDAWGNLITKTPAYEPNSNDTNITSSLLAIKEESLDIDDGDNMMAENLEVVIKEVDTDLSSCENISSRGTVMQSPAQVKDELVDIGYFESITSQVQLLLGRTNEDEFVTDDYHPQEPRSIKEEKSSVYVEQESKTYTYPSSKDPVHDEDVKEKIKDGTKREISEEAFPETCYQFSTWDSANAKEPNISIKIGSDEKVLGQVSDMSDGTPGEHSKLTEQTKKHSTVLSNLKRRCMSRSSTDDRVAVSEETAEESPCKKSIDTSSATQVCDLFPETVDGKNESKVEKEVFKCASCPKQYSNKFSLHAHSYVHFDEKRLDCSTCEKHFRSVSSLRVHERRHCDRKLFTCDECLKGFVTKSELVTHKLFHKKERKFVCDECGQGFIIKSNLINHMVVHTGSKPYKCEICGVSFTLKGNLRRHKSMVHSKSKKKKAC